MKRVLVVGCGGFLGAVARYAVSLAIARFWSGQFPLGTFLINVSGSFILGLFSTLGVERLGVSPEVRLLVATGFVGAYTTFSTFEYETLYLTKTDAGAWALAYVLGSVVAGFAAVWLGVKIGR